MSFFLQSLQFCSKKLYQAPSPAHVVNADWPMERNSIGHGVAKQLPSTWLEEIDSEIPETFHTS